MRTKTKRNGKPKKTELPRLCHAPVQLRLWLSQRGQWTDASPVKRWPLFLLPALVRSIAVKVQFV